MPHTMVNLSNTPRNIGIQMLNTSPLRVISLDKQIPVGGGNKLTGIQLTDSNELNFIFSDDSQLKTSPLPEIQLEWEGTRLGVRVGEGEFSYTDLKGNVGNDGDKGDAFVFEDFTSEQLALLKGSDGDKGNDGVSLSFSWDDTRLGVKTSEQQSYTYTDLKGSKGSKGDAFTYQDFTQEQLDSFKGDSGSDGVDGVNGKNLQFQWQGDSLGIRVEGDSSYLYKNLKGVKGDAGDKGSAFTFDDFTPQQLESLKVKGDKGDSGEDGVSLEFSWDDTRLGIRQVGGSYSYVELKGASGNDGNNGVDGKNLEFNWNGTQLGVRVQGDTSYTYTQLKGVNGEKGAEGKSAYQIAVDGGYSGTSSEWIASLSGSDGSDGDDGVKGDTGKSAYQVWIGLGNSGTEADFISSLKGDKGDKGDSGSGGGSNFLTISQTDFTQSEFIYYGGVDSNSVFKINRYSKSNLTQRTQSTGNWSDRYTLTYT